MGFLVLLLLHIRHINNRKGGSIKKQFQKDFNRDLLSKLSHKHVFRKKNMARSKNKAKKEKGLAGRGIITVMIVRPHCL